MPDDSLMRFGIEVVTLGEFADPKRTVRLAVAAERAGWEAVVVWDHLAFVWGVPSADPWVTLSAVASATERLRVVTGVAALPRHRPHVLAHLLSTLDHLSDGRVTLGAGLGGVDAEFTAFGESGDVRERANMTDEALALIDRLWQGEEVRHEGAHYRVDGVRLAPLPVQRPRIPIWTGGESVGALKRAARWDGWIVGAVAQDGTMTKTPSQIGSLVARIRRERDARGEDAASRFDFAITGQSTPGDRESVQGYAGAGVTWWFESLHGSRGSERELLDRIESGPPG